jgi:hypothetical protein
MEDMEYLPAAGFLECRQSGRFECHKETLNQTGGRAKEKGGRA